MTEILERNEAALQAYHDGELRGLSRWRFERRLARSPELQRELVLLGRMGDWVREEGGGEAPDLWQGIARRLEAGEAGPTQGWLEGRLQGRTPAAVLGSLVKPLGAVAVAAAAAMVLLQPASTPGPPASPTGDRVVRWIDSGGRNVLVDDRAGESVTVIWLLDAPVEGASREGHRETV